MWQVKLGIVFTWHLAYVLFAQVSATAGNVHYSQTDTCHEWANDNDGTVNPRM